TNSGSSLSRMKETDLPSLQSRRHPRDLSVCASRNPTAWPWRSLVWRERHCHTRGSAPSRGRRQYDYCCASTVCGSLLPLASVVSKSLTYTIAAFPVGGSMATSKRSSKLRVPGAHAVPWVQITPV